MHKRWFRTLKDSFYPEASRAGIQTLAELNQFLWGWLERVYHARVHSQTKETPKARWEAGAAAVRYPDPALLVDLFLWEEKRHVDKSGCIHLGGNLYSVAEHLVGQEVTVRFDPFDLSRIRLYESGHFTETLEPQTLVSQTFRKAHRKSTDKSALRSSSDYREQLSKNLAGQAQEVQKLARGLRGACLTQAEFLTLLSATLGVERVLTLAESIMATEFFLRNAPLAETQVRSAMNKAIEAKSAALHLRYYLEAIRAGRMEAA